MATRTQGFRAAWPLVCALVGGGMALGGASVLGKLGTTKTTIEQVAAPLPATSSTPADTSGALSVEQIYKRDAPGVVEITATSDVNASSDPLGFLAKPQTQKSLGSGFVIDKAGHIVTNDRVIAGAEKVQVSFSGNDQIRAKVVGKDAASDVAVLQINAHSRALTPIPLGDSDLVQVGDPVVAIGNPFSLTRTATAGIVSAVQRTVDAPAGLAIDQAIQTDAAINHGNSGGPLIDSRGDVIGLSTQISAAAAGNQGDAGVGFAIPIDAVKTAVAQLIQTGKVTDAYLGVGAVPVTTGLAKLFDLPTDAGLLVEDVATGSPAAKAELRAGSSTVVVEGESYRVGGDIIVSANGAPVTTLGQLRDMIESEKPGDRVSLVVDRAGSRHTIGVTLGRPPS
ncbi:MAG TPA: trypsin-like peptidase domain-containing protein [Gaiellaceae bacterium]|nr:trypsin-like peptidase domain-containing protein [Gaiellaceae bacterium]